MGRGSKGDKVAGIVGMSTFQGRCICTYSRHDVLLAGQAIRSRIYLAWKEGAGLYMHSLIIMGDRRELVLASSR